MHRSEKGFTLMELMVVIVIVAILAAVAVPLYINYVKDAQRTEAKAAIGAIITAEQAYYLKSPQLREDKTPSYGTQDDLKANGFLDEAFLNDAKARWNQPMVTSAGLTGFVVTAANPKDATVTVTYTYTVSGQNSGGKWE